MSDDKRLGPPPVEPLSDAAWSRVERGMWAELDLVSMSRSEPVAVATPTLAYARRWWLVAVPLAAAAAAATIVIGTRTSTPEIAEEPSRLVSGSAPSSVSFGDAHIELDADTAFVMSHETGHPVVLLERGAAWFTVTPRLSRPDFIVRAGDATVHVVGTRFRVTRSGEQIAVAVEHGKVNVQFRGRMAAIGARQRWSSESPRQITAAAEAAPRVAAADPDEPEIDFSDLLDPAGSSAAPLTTPLAPGPGRKHVANSGSMSESKLGSKYDARTESATGSGHAGGAAAIDRDRAAYDRLAALEPQDPGAALAGYLALARGTSRWADPALFAAARLAADRHDRRAVTLLAIYLRRFPTGANAIDAKQLFVRLKEDHP
jgi:hypothetical protein